MNWDEWYSPGSVRFTIRQTLWLIRSLPTLRDGEWPTDAENYKVRSKKAGKAPFEIPISYAVEIQERLERCGVDGLILEAIEGWDKSIESITKYLKIPGWSIRKRRKLALGYVASGPARRWHKTRIRDAETYREFKDRKKKK